MLFVGIVCSVVVSSATAIPIEDFEEEAAAERWAFSNGPEFPGARGEFAVVPEAAHSGQRSGRLRFDFSGGGSYVQASVPLPPESNLRWLTLWIRKPVPNRMTFRCVDTAGETFQKSFNYQTMDWQRVRVDLRSWGFHWGGDANGIFDEPPRQFGILLERADGIERGEVYFDDILGEEGALGEAETPQYVLNLPLPSDRNVWRTRVHGPADGARWDGDRLRIDFPRGVKSVSLTTHHSLLGNPQEIRILASSPGTDIFVTIVLYSHFQKFERRILIPRSHPGVSVDRWGVGGELRSGSGYSDLPAPKTIPVPLGGLEGWQHSGGADDGVVRPPLRLVEIRLEAPDDAGPTTVQFHDLKVVTRADTGEEFILYGRGAVIGEKEAEFRLLGRSLLDRDIILRVPYTLYSHSGRKLGNGKTEFTLRGGGRLSESVVRARIGDEPFVEGEFLVPLPLLPKRRVLANVARPLPSVADPRQDPSSIFGMGLYLYRYPPTENGYAQMDRAAAMAAAAGVKWSREEFGWGRIEPERGEFRWEFYDRMVATAARHGVSIYGLLCYWSPWTEPFTERGIEDYCDFVSETVRRYRGQIQHWEVWNEPNIFFWSGPKEVYTQLLKRAYRIIKEANPEAKVLGCSTAGIDMAFVKQVVSAGGPFDILTIHPYRGSLDDAGFMQELRHTRETVSELVGRDVPVWITEMGWPTHLAGLSEREAASRLSRVYLCAAASGAVGNVSWYDFRNDANDPLYNEANFGVVNHDLTPKPAYRALATICRSLAGLSVSRQLEWGDDVLAFLFEGNGRKLVAVWSVSGDRLLTLRGKGNSPIEAIDLMGSQAPAMVIGDLVSVWLMQESPVLLEMDEVPEAAAGSLELSIEPRIVRGGTEVSIMCKATEPVSKHLRVEWDNSLGWPSEKDRRRHGDTAIWQLRLEVPESALPGRRRTGVLIRRKRERIQGWISFDVVPETLDI